MQITRVLEQALEEKLQHHKPAIVTQVANYAASLSHALASGHTKADVAGHVMLETEETMQKQVKWELVKCSKGCSLCCYVNVEMTEGEADVIIEYCQKKNIAIDKDILAEQAGLTSSERPFHKYSKCIFLLSDGTCGIYEARPLNCRKHLSLSDPDLCNCKKYPDGRVMINVEINTEIIVSAYHNLGMKQGTMAQMLLHKLVP